MPKDRRIEDIPSRLGNFIDLVEQEIKRRGKVRVLDAGCGYGTAMMGFVRKFGELVDMWGINYSEYDGDSEMMKKDSISKRIFSEEELDGLENLPKFVYCDASEKLPFESDSFDFIYSMNSLHYYDDKIHFLEECNRILGENGIARINSAFSIHLLREGNPRKYTEFWEIWDEGKEVKAWEYLNRVNGVRVVMKSGSIEEYKPQYIEIQKQSKLNFGLRLISSIDFNFLWKEWSGVKSIYTTQLEFEPKWKR